MILFFQLDNLRHLTHIIQILRLMLSVPSTKNITDHIWIILINNIEIYK